MKDSVTRAARVLVVDDEADIRALIEITLNRMGLEVAAAGDLAAARRQLEDFRFDLCLTDMRLPDGDGITLVTELQRHYPHTPVAVITAYGSAQTAVDSLKAGAFDFVSKPLQVATLRKLVDDALRLRGTNSPAPTALETELLGEAPAMRKLRALIERVARSQAPVHISGESGTGKELVARTIHALGPRANASFVPVNCGAIPADLMESELFGHVRGSFTGAVADNPGLFRAAEGGTLFLDEVADLPLHMQVKLLRAVQERAVRAVGATSETPIDVRIVSATHENLARRVADGSFRQDLYYRLNVIELQTPPLRDHAQDIPLLARQIVERISARTGNARPAELTADALTVLTAYPFPGNVRELENILERALALCDTTQITAADLALRDAQPCEDAQRVLPSASPAHRAEEAPLDARVEGLQREAIVAALEKTRWNRTRAADLLGMSFRQLRYRLKKLGIE